MSAIMDYIYTIVGYPLGWAMWLCYQLTNNYALSLLIFTIIMRLALLPITLKQQKSTIKMQMLRPKIDDLQKKYAKNREKLNEETMKLYQQEGYNPMAGCLPMVIQLVIMFGLIDVIYKPLKHIVRLPSDLLNKAMELVAGTAGYVERSGLNTNQLVIITDLQQNPEKYSILGAKWVETIQSLNLNFFSMDLSQRPTVAMFTSIFSEFNPLIFIPILAGGSALLMSIIQMKTQQGGMGGADAPGGASMKSMMLMMPVMSTVISFSVPAGVGLYWFYSNLVAIVQSLVIHKYFNPKKLAEKMKQEEEERKERERQERIEARKQAALKGEADPDKLSQKELNRRKLAEARRRDAEKYGEVYVDVTDEDI